MAAIARLAIILLLAGLWGWGLPGLATFNASALAVSDPAGLPPAAPRPVTQLSTIQLPTAQIIVASAPPNPATALERLFTQSLRSDWFTPQFLRQVPPRELQRGLNEISQELGAYQRVVAVEDGYEVQFAEGAKAAQIALTPEGQIAQLLFRPLVTPLGLDEAIAAIEASPHQASLLITHNGAEIAAVGADVPLAVGSSFKLAVLRALQAQISTGARRWDQVVTLEPQWKSLPSGMLQDWPSGSSLTLETLATLMISVSDNTATDALIYIVGRQTIESYAPRNQPFLTTREFFTLKNPANADLLTRYRAGDVAARRQVVAGLGDRPLPDKALFAAEPVAPDVEWFFTPRELCRLMADVADLPLMQVNPGVATPRHWARVAFKGGSEPGVLNLTTQLESRQGERYCISATWNSEEALDETALTQLYRSMILGLR